MSKSKKKRSKKYRGARNSGGGSAVKIRRVHAVTRSDRAQWFFENKGKIKKWTIAIVVAGVLLALIISGIRALIG